MLASIHETFIINRNTRIHHLSFEETAEDLTVVRPVTIFPAGAPSLPSGQGNRGEPREGPHSEGVVEGRTLQKDLVGIRERIDRRALSFQPDLEASRWPREDDALPRISVMTVPRASVTFLMCAGFSTLALSFFLGLADFFLAESLPILRTRGLGFLLDPVWSPPHGRYGALSMIHGTVMVAGLALLVAGPIGVLGGI